MRLSEYQVESEKSIDRYQFNKIIEEESLCGMATELGKLNAFYIDKGPHMSEEDDNIRRKRCVGGMLFYLNEYCTAHNWSIDRIAEEDLERRRNGEQKQEIDAGY